MTERNWYLIEQYADALTVIDKYEYLSEAMHAGVLNKALSPNRYYFITREFLEIGEIVDADCVSAAWKIIN